MFYKPDYNLGGLVVLEITDSRKIDKFLAVTGWRVVFQYGNIKDINFKLFEKQSKAECFFLNEKNLYKNFADIAELIKHDIDNFVNYARDLKEDTKLLIKETKQETEEILAECETDLKRLDKQIRDFSNLDIEREFEKRGLMF